MAFIPGIRVVTSAFVIGFDMAGVGVVAEQAFVLVAGSLVVTHVAVANINGIAAHVALGVDARSLSIAFIVSGGAALTSLGAVGPSGCGAARAVVCMTLSSFGSSARWPGLTPV